MAKIKITPAPRCTGYQYYTNPKSQGTLMCQTPGFPASFDDETHECASAYTDRLQTWDMDRYREAGQKLKPGSLRNATPEALKAFCQIAFDKESLPVHARAVYYFNQSTGYDCPRVDAIFEKEQSA